MKMGQIHGLSVLYKPEVSGRLAKWAVELGELRDFFTSHNYKVTGPGRLCGQILPYLVPSSGARSAPPKRNKVRGRMGPAVDGSNNIRGARNSADLADR